MQGVESAKKEAGIQCRKNDIRVYRKKHRKKNDDTRQYEFIEKTQKNLVMSEKCSIFAVDLLEKRTKDTKTALEKRTKDTQTALEKRTKHIITYA